ncbi:unnamed protein product [Linum trigynum]|uniref:Uncharacterized protein n=1 Tax=Linum trigynum TaxID=586398 RepID=A0AAV2FQ07_9ROSI
MGWRGRGVGRAGEGAADNGVGEPEPEQSKSGGGRSSDWESGLEMEKRSRGLAGEEEESQRGREESRLPIRDCDL